MTEDKTTATKTALTPNLNEWEKRGVAWLKERSQADEGGRTGSGWRLTGTQLDSFDLERSKIREKGKLNVFAKSYWGEHRVSELWWHLVAEAQIACPGWTAPPLLLGASEFKRILLTQHKCTLTWQSLSIPGNRRNMATLLLVWSESWEKDLESKQRIGWWRSAWAGYVL